MSNHIAAFAEFLNRLPQIRENRAATVTRRIMRIFDSSTDVPGEIEALLCEEFERVWAGHA